MKMNLISMNYIKIINCTTQPTKSFRKNENCNRSGFGVRSKLYSFSYNRNSQKSNKKGIQKATECEDYTRCLFMSESTSATNYSIRSNLHNITVEKQNKLALIPFDVKRVYLHPIQSLPLDKPTQKGDCPCIYCLKIIVLYY